ncbi:hypothetical protein HK102_009498, partial [Quaeritorhiza haematococci]
VQKLGQTSRKRKRSMEQEKIVVSQPQSQPTETEDPADPADPVVQAPAQDPNLTTQPLKNSFRFSETFVENRDEQRWSEETAPRMIGGIVSAVARSCAALEVLQLQLRTINGNPTTGTVDEKDEADLLAKCPKLRGLYVDGLKMKSSWSDPTVR